MNSYEYLIQESAAIVDDRADLTSGFKGLYIETPYRHLILIARDVQTSVERRCILAEELGHYHTSAGNILNQNDIRHVKQEKRARNWAYTKLVPFFEIIRARKAGVRNRFELADFLDVTEDFVDQSIERYKEKYGLCTLYGKHMIYFDPIDAVEVIS